MIRFRELLSEEVPIVKHVRSHPTFDDQTTHLFTVHHSALQKPMGVRVTQNGSEGWIDVHATDGEEYKDTWAKQANKLGPTAVRHVAKEIGKRIGVHTFIGLRGTGAKAGYGASIRLKEAIEDLLG